MTLKYGAIIYMGVVYTCWCCGTAYAVEGSMTGPRCACMQSFCAACNKCMPHCVCKFQSSPSPKAGCNRRLRRKAPELHEKVLAGALSPHAAMIEAGLRQRTVTIPVEPNAAARALIKHFPRDAIIAQLEAHLA